MEQRGGQVESGRMGGRSCFTFSGCASRTSEQDVLHCPRRDILNSDACGRGGQASYGNSDV
eukprot:3304559-Amphidinium_carterae.1